MPSRGSVLVSAGQSIYASSWQTQRVKGAPFGEMEFVSLVRSEDHMGRLREERKRWSVRSGRLDEIPLTAR